MIFLMRRFTWRNHTRICCSEGKVYFKSKSLYDLKDYSILSIRGSYSHVVYVDHIVNTEDNVQEISDLRSNLRQKFQTKDQDHTIFFEDWKT